VTSSHSFRGFARSDPDGVVLDQPFRPSRAVVVWSGRALFGAFRQRDPCCGEVRQLEAFGESVVHVAECPERLVLTCRTATQLREEREGRR
jgi:hypothetical protein